MLAVLALMAALVWWFWKRKHRHRGNFDIDGGTPEKYLSGEDADPLFTLFYRADDYQYLPQSQLIPSQH